MDRNYKCNWDEMIRWLLTSMNHRINNTGWTTEWRWNGGVERKAKPLRECWTFFNLHFPASVLEAMSRICACKTEKNLQMFGWCLQIKQSWLRATLSYFCLRKQSRKINAMRQVVFEKCVKKSSALSHAKCGEVSSQIEFATLSPKNHDLFVKQERKGNGKNNENAAPG
jgi:hypothetical protein